jgi:capsular polysaccharide transport system permease protein
MKRLKTFLLRHLLFFVSVLIPTTLSVAYFGFLANDVYVSESAFVVRAPNRQQQSGFGSILSQLGAGGGAGFSAATDESSSVKDFIASRDALALVEKEVGFRAIFSSQQIHCLQRFNGLGLGGSFEDLFEYYLKQVSVTVVPSGVKLTVKAFDAETSQRVSQLLLSAAESFVNGMNERARADLVAFSRNEVEIAEKKVKDAALALTNYRNTENVVDPQKQVATHFAQLAKLHEQELVTKGQLAQVLEFAPDSPQVKSLKLTLQTLEREIKAEKERVAGGAGSLVSKTSEYERLSLEMDFADKQLAAAMASLESARSQALRQQLYLITVAKPSLPDAAVLPRRARSVVTTVILGLVSWGILALLLAGVREHQY